MLINSIITKPYEHPPSKRSRKDQATHAATMLKTGSSFLLVLILQTLMSKWAQPTTSVRRERAVPEVAQRAESKHNKQDTHRTLWLINCRGWTKRLLKIWEL